MKNALSAVKALLLNALFIGPIAYTAFNRTGKEFLHEWFLLTAIAFVLMVISTARSKHPDEDGHTGFMITHGHILGSMLVGLLIYAAVATVGDALKLLWLPQIKHERALITGGVLALSGGAILFALRLKYRAIYGLTEATVGALVAAQRFSESNGQVGGFSFFIVFLTAGIYLVVRGLDNIHQGITKAPIDPLAARFLASIRSKSPP